MAGTSRILDNYFKITERGSTMNREVRGGLVTFVAMSYIVVLNPLILGSFSADDAAAKTDVLGNILPVTQVAAVTALVAGLMSIAFGIVANYPFGIAAGLGINTLLAVTIAPQVTWPEAMGLVVIDGIIIVVLAITGFRTAVFNAIPDALKSAIAAGIGMFIAFIGFVDAGFVRRIPDEAGTTVPVGLGINGSISSWPTVVFVFGVLLMGILVARRVRGGLLIGIVVTTVLAAILEAVFDIGPSAGVDPKGWNLTVPGMPDVLLQTPNLSLVGDVNLFGAFTRIGVLSASLLVFTLVLANFFDAMGTMTGLGKEAELTDKHGTLPNVGKALVVEGTGAIVGGAASASSNTVFVESASGIAEGANGTRERRHRSAVPGRDVPHAAVRDRPDRGGRSRARGGRCADDRSGPRHRLHEVRRRPARVPDDGRHAVHLLDRQRHRRRLHRLGRDRRRERQGEADSSTAVDRRRTVRRILRCRSDNRRAHLNSAIT